MILVFCMQINIFLQVNALILLGVVSNFHSNQYERFVISLQYLKKEVSVKVSCLNLQKVSCQLILPFLVKMARDVQITGQQYLEITWQKIWIFSLKKPVSHANNIQNIKSKIYLEWVVTLARCQASNALNGFNYVSFGVTKVFSFYLINYMVYFILSVIINVWHHCLHSHHTSSYTCSLYVFSLTRGLLLLCTCFVLSALKCVTTNIMPVIKTTLNMCPQLTKMQPV